MMRLGVALFLFAVGAILAFAVKVEPTAALNLNTVGWILMLVGVIGGGIWFAFWSPGLGRHRPPVAEVPPPSRDPLDEGRC
jgi:hypothetical protein